MQNRKTNRFHPEVGESILEFFINNIDDDKSVKNILRVLSIINGYVLNHQGTYSTEIFDFGNFFIANGLEEFTRQERKKAFEGKEPLILNKYFEIAGKIERQEIIEMIEEISHEEIFEAMTLTDSIFDITDDKVIILSIEDGPIEFKYDKSSKQHYDVLKKEFFDYMCYAIMLGTAGIVVRIKKKPKDLLLGIRIDGGGWHPLPVHEFIENYVDELDMSVRYTELPMRY